MQGVATSLPAPWLIGELHVWSVHLGRTLIHAAYMADRVCARAKVYSNHLGEPHASGQIPRTLVACGRNTQSQCIRALPTPRLTCEPDLSTSYLSTMDTAIAASGSMLGVGFTET